MPKIPNVKNQQILSYAYSDDPLWSNTDKNKIK